MMRIDQEETRYFPLGIGPVKGKINTNIDNDLFNEIPKFLRYLLQLPAIDFSKDRLVFTKEETETAHLTAIKEESKSWMRKELEMHVQDFFDNSSADEFFAAAIDIKHKWFPRDNQVKASYISKVLRQEMKMQVEKNQRYYPFGIVDMGSERVSTPFRFVRTTEFIPNKPIQSTIHDELDLN